MDLLGGLAGTLFASLLGAQGDRGARDADDDWSRIEIVSYSLPRAQSDEQDLEFVLGLLDLDL